VFRVSGLSNRHRQHAHNTHSNTFSTGTAQWLPQQWYSYQRFYRHCVFRVSGLRIVTGNHSHNTHRATVTLQLLSLRTSRHALRTHNSPTTQRGQRLGLTRRRSCAPRTARSPCRCRSPGSRRGGSRSSRLPQQGHTTRLQTSPHVGSTHLNDINSAEVRTPIPINQYL
jgi:hypothetical protein